jgi:hypothetical protein
VRRVKRSILLKNPVWDFSQLLLIDQPLGQGPESRHEAIHRMGIMAVPGGRLLVLDGLHPGGRLRQLAPQQPGSYWRPDLSFDAQKALFCFKPHKPQETQEKGTGPICRDGPKGASHKLDLSPFPPLVRMARSLLGQELEVDRDEAAADGSLHPKESR